MRVVRDQLRPGAAQGMRKGGRVEAREQTNRQLEGQGAEGDEEKKEEVLEDEWLGMQDRGVGRRR